MTTGNVNSYLDLRPVTASSTGGAAKGATIAIVVDLVVVVAGVAIWLVIGTFAGDHPASSLVPVDGSGTSNSHTPSPYDP
jgi:hypothetical protein